MQNMEIDQQYIPAREKSFQQLQMRDFVAVSSVDSEDWRLGTILNIKRDRQGKVQYILVVLHEPSDGSARVQVDADMIDRLKVSRRKFGRVQ